MTPTNGRKPRTGDAKLRVKFRNGWVSKWEYTAGQLQWAQNRDGFPPEWDIIEVERA